IWKSTIKVANNNPEEHTIYVEAVDFRAKQEDGVVEFLSSEKTGTSSEGVSPFLSQWIVLEENEVVIPAFGSREIPYIIDVPENASPGGHYAAILAGTRPPADSVSGSVIKVSSLLASLVLLNVKGDVEERGVIREFVSDKVFYDKTDVGFKVRFENLGNVHLQPLGEIKIYAPFNKLKNTITINHNSEFGNVLPESIRKWEFNWKGDKNLLEMGRYRAELILGYGEEGRQADNRVIYFWVIYPKPVIFAVSAVIIFILLITVLIRLYIRRAIRNTTGLNTQIVGKKSEPAKKIFFKRSQSKPEKKDDVINLKK
ncbi:MAG TPA: hypothetical protein VJB62_00255, partial [Patescibacteria group bacterium]|nr:hypothetical protein [Patescibacteria group bacterium]